MRLVVDKRGLVARLLSLDPTPLTLRSMAALFKLLAVLDRSAVPAHSLQIGLASLWQTPLTRSWVCSG